MSDTEDEKKHECKFCGAKLTSPKSIKRGIGPECLNKYDPFSCCQHCLLEEDELARKEGRELNWDNITKKTNLEDWKRYRNTDFPSCTKKFADTENNRRRGLVGKTHQTDNSWGGYEEIWWCLVCESGDYVTWDDVWKNVGINGNGVTSCAFCRGETIGKGDLNE